MIKDIVKRECVNCVIGCLICSSLTTCERCMDHYYITNENKTCEYQKKLYAQITTTFSPFIYNLVFTDIWPPFFNKFSENLKIYIEDYNESNYNYTLVLEKNFYIVTFDFRTPIIKNNTMYLQINYEDKFDEEFILVSKNFIVTVPPYCPLPEIYLSSKILQFLSKFILFNSFLAKKKLRSNLLYRAFA